MGTRRVFERHRNTFVGDLGIPVAVVSSSLIFNRGRVDAREERCTTMRGPCRGLELEPAPSLKEFFLYWKAIIERALHVGRLIINH